MTYETSENPILGVGTGKSPQYFRMAGGCLWRGREPDHLQSESLSATSPCVMPEGWQGLPELTAGHICTSPWATYPPPPPPQWYGPPTPPHQHHPHLGDDVSNAGDAVRASPALSPREPTPPHLSQHPTLNQTTLQPLLNPNPKPKSTQTPNPPETHRKPTLNQP